jgi:hypothetical protein
VAEGEALGTQRRCVESMTFGRTAADVNISLTRLLQYPSIVASHNVIKSPGNFLHLGLHVFCLVLARRASAPPKHR